MGTNGNQTAGTESATANTTKPNADPKDEGKDKAKEKNKKRKFKSCRRRRCRGCGVWVNPDPCNAYHQCFCNRPLCRLLSRRTSQRRWRRKDPSGATLTPMRCG